MNVNKGKTQSQESSTTSLVVGCKHKVLLMRTTASAHLCGSRNPANRVAGKQSRGTTAEDSVGMFTNKPSQ